MEYWMRLMLKEELRSGIEVCSLCFPDTGCPGRASTHSLHSGGRTISDEDLVWIAMQLHPEYKTEPEKAERLVKFTKTRRR